jgi:hypothetical protein
MPRRPRRILIALLVAFHATVTTCGSCLHALPGWDHGATVRGPERDGRQIDPGKDLHESSHHCPICQFLAQGQLPIGVMSGPALRLVCVLVTQDLPEITPRSSRRPSCPRAPPIPYAIPA